MALNPQVKGELMKFTTAAKAIIYKPQNMDQFMDMINTANGAVQAVHTVIAAIEQRKPIPPEVTPLLGVNIYMLMVDVAQEATGQSPDGEIVKKVIGKIMQSIGQSHGPKQEAAEQPQAEMSEGMPEESQETPQQESAEPAVEQQEEQQAGTEIPMQGGIIGRNLRR